ncbi:MAG: PepSY-associated TM helix domain-containing protein [Azospirillaceae bacterium]|nr:PepSY-associated TM helix domain-containing protein [Azospirillaceae bacterium]
MLKHFAARALARRKNPDPTDIKGKGKAAKGGFVQSSLAGHSALGLALGALVYIVCFTGTLSVFAEDLSRWEWAGTAETPELPAAAIDAAMATGLERAVAQAGGVDKVIALYGQLPRPDWPHMAVHAFTAGGGSVMWRAAADGTLSPTPSDNWTDVMGEVHMELSLPGLWGPLTVGLVGIALLSLLFSGVLSHPRIFRDAFALRLTGARRLGLADLHNRLSVWGLPFHLGITITGLIFALAGVMLLTVAQVGFKGDTTRAAAPLSGPEIAADPTPAPMPSVALLQQRVEEAMPGSHRTTRFLYIERPGTAGQSVMMDMGRYDGLAQGDRYYLNAKGDLVTPSGFIGGPVGKRVYAAALALHCATFGGLAVRLVYGVLGLALSVICATGCSIFLARRRDRGRALPRLEKVWAGVAWGVPLAMALSAATTLVPGLANEHAYVRGFWAPTLILPILSLALASGEQASRVLRLALGLVLVILAGTHAAGHATGQWGDGPLPAAALVVDAVLAVTGLALTVTTGLLRRSRALAAQAHPAP